MNFNLPNFSVIISEDEVVNFLFQVSSEWQIHNRIIHWNRPHRLRNAPMVPEDFLYDPIRLQRIFFYYGSQYAMKTACETAFDPSYRKNLDCLIVEYPDITHKGALAVLLGVLCQFSKNERKALVIMKEKQYVNLISMYTTNIFELKGDNLIRLSCDVA